MVQITRTSNGAQMVLGVWETTQLQQGHMLSADGGVWVFFFYVPQSMETF